MAKPKAGLCLLYEKWFSDYCDNPNNVEQGSELKKYLGEDSAAVTRQLEKYFDLTYTGPMASVTDVERNVTAFRSNDVELIIVISLFWSGDKPLIRLLEKFRSLPVLLWCYTPFQTLPDHMGMNDLFRSSGVVGAVQTSAPIRKMGISFAYVFGSPFDARLECELAAYARAFTARKNMRGLRLGHIGGRYEEMTGTYADEFFLLSKLGVELVPISAYRLYQAACGLSETDIRGYMDTLTKRCRSVSVSDEALYYAVRASLAVGQVALDEGLGAIALEDFNTEMHTLLKTRPQLWIPALDDLRIVPSMEGDVLAAMALWISQQLGSSLPMYTEMFAFDQQRNALLMGHAAMNCPDIAGTNPPSIIPDAECGALDEVEGAWLHFKGKDGGVVVAGLFDTGGGAYRATLFRGQARYSDLLDTSPNVLVHIDTPLESFYRQVITAGMTQHFALSYDDIASGWIKFCEICGIEFLEIQ